MNNYGILKTGLAIWKTCLGWNTGDQRAHGESGDEFYFGI